MISAIGFSTSDPLASWFSTELALLKATVEAGAKRFAPSEYGIGVLAPPKIEALNGSVRIWEACEEAAAVGGLEWTRYECGLFMNYLGFGVPGDSPSGRELREEALGGREKDGEWMYYPSTCRAELPVKVDGTFPRITLTAIEDVGKLVAKSLELSSWETTSYIVGETLRMDEVVRIAEKGMGKTWKVERLSVDELETRIASENDTEKKLWAQLAQSYGRDVEGEGWFEGNLNRLFPDISLLTVEGYFNKYYS